MPYCRYYISLYHLCQHIFVTYLLPEYPILSASLLFADQKRGTRELHPYCLKRLHISIGHPFVCKDNILV